MLYATQPWKQSWAGWSPVRVPPALQDPLLSASPAHRCPAQAAFHGVVCSSMSFPYKQRPASRRRLSRAASPASFTSGFLSRLLPGGQPPLPAPAVCKGHQTEQVGNWPQVQCPAFAPCLLLDKPPHHPLLCSRSGVPLARQPDTKHLHHSAGHEGQFPQIVPATQPVAPGRSGTWVQGASNQVIRVLVPPGSWIPALRDRTSPRESPTL